MFRKPILRELTIFALFVTLAVALTWPLAANLPTAVNDLGDPLFVAWVLEWVCHAIIHQPLHLYDAPIFHPGILPLAYSENFVAVAILMLPLHLAGASPLTLHNVAYLLGLALSGYGAFVLARMVTRETIGALVGGIFYGFCAFKFDHLAHLQVIFSPWVPLLLAALLAFWEKPTKGRGAFLTLLWVANGLTNIYFLMFAGVATLFTVGLLAVIRPRGWRFYAGLGASTLAALLILMPFLQPYRAVSKHYHMVRSAGEVIGGSAHWTNWLIPGRLNRMYGTIAKNALYEPEKQLFPGMAILILAGAGWFLWRGVAESSSRRVDEENLDASEASPPRRLEDSKTRRHVHPTMRPLDHPTMRPLVLLDVSIVILLILTWATLVTDRVEIKFLGRRLLAADSSDIPLMALLVLVLIRCAIRLPRALGGVPLREAFERSRFPAGAWVAAVWVFAGILGSLGTNSFFYTFFYRRFEPFQAMRVPARFAIVAYVGLAVWGALGAAALVHARAGRKRVLVAALLIVVMVADVAPRIRWELAPLETPPVYTWLGKTKAGPVLELPFTGNGVDYLYLLGSTAHHVPLVNGTSGFFPPEFWKVGEPESRDDFDAMLNVAEQFNVRLVIVHGPFLGGRRAKLTDFLRRQMASHRLEFLRHFENRLDGDYVFAVTRNLPQWRTLAAPEVPDGGGFLPRQTLERFFANLSTHTDAVLVNTDYPLSHMTVNGQLRVSGWALSPHGVRRVTVRMHMGKQIYEAQRVARPDVLAAYPWMRYTNDTPGFQLILHQRPKGIPMETSVQVEVEDLAGRVRRGRDTLIRWEK